jgi:hypothetical protein
MAETATYYPSQAWKQVNRVRTIPYDDETQYSLMSRHPDTRGILADVNGRLISVQMLVPNNMRYNDSFFSGLELKYHPSVSHQEGNDAMERALRNGECFRVFAGFKRGKAGDLRQLGVPAFWHGKSVDLGIAKIDRRENGVYVIVPCGKSDAAKEFVATQWRVRGEDGYIYQLPL